MPYIFSRLQWGFYGMNRFVKDHRCVTFSRDCTCEFKDCRFVAEWPNDSQHPVEGLPCSISWIRESGRENQKEAGAERFSVHTWLYYEIANSEHARHIAIVDTEICENASLIEIG